MTLTVDDIDKMKVADLKSELSSRGLDTKGLKKDLAERLKAAVESEQGDSVEKEDDDAEASNDIPEPESQNDESMNESQEENVPDTSEGPGKVETEEPRAEPEVTATADENQSVSAAPVPEAEASTIEDDSTAKGPNEEHPEDADASTMEDDSADKDAKEGHPDDSTAAVYGGKDETMAELDETVKAEPEQADEQMGDDTKQENEAKPESEVKQEGEEKSGGDEAKQGGEETKQEKEEPKTEQKQERGAKRKREEPAPVFDTVELDEPEFDKDAVHLDWYNSDLHLVIDRENLCKASPLSNAGFAYIWAGARASYGVKTGKVAFEVKSVEENSTSHLVNEADPHVLRIGFSTDDTSMQLGEEPLSFGYGATGKKSVNLQFSNYGVAFGLNDVIGAYLDFSDDTVSISYTKNGEDLGEAFNIPLGDLEGKALFPHVLTKNVKFECNFGQLPEPWFAVKEGYTLVGQVPVEERVRGAEAPATRSECEIIMLIGLPGAGKTTWASKYAREHPEKKYNILGTNALIDKMKVAGLNRKRNYAGRWDQLIQKCTDCLNRLLVLAAKRRRNYILDQTNVYPSARRRKLKCYGEFIRRAVVIVPSDEEFKTRVAKREAEEGKDVPDEAVLEMKANFRLPEEGGLFTAIEYADLAAEEAAKLVEQYNAEGVKAGYGITHKKPRVEERYQGHDRSDDRRRDHRRNDTWGGRTERDYNRPSPRFDDRRDVGRDQRRSFDNRREAGGYGGRMPQAAGGRFGGYSGGYGGPSPRGGGGGYGDRERMGQRQGYGGGGGGDYYRGGSSGGDYGRGVSSGGDYSRRGSSGGDYGRGGASGGDYSRGGASGAAYSRGGSSTGGYSRGRSSGGDYNRRGGDRRPQQATGGQARYGSPAASAPRPAPTTPSTGHARTQSWDTTTPQQQTWAQPTQTPATTDPAWGQQAWGQGYYDPATYSQYAQQGYWNGQSYDYQAAWQQQQQMYYNQAAAGQTPAAPANAAGTQATQQGTWKSY